MPRTKAVIGEEGRWAAPVPTAPLQRVIGPHLNHVALGDGQLLAVPGHEVVNGAGAQEGLAGCESGGDGVAATLFNVQ